MKDCVCGQSVRADERFASDCWLPTERKGNFSCQIIKKETTATEKTAQVRSPGQSRSGQGMRIAGKRMVRETVRKIIADKITELITVRVIRIREIMDREIIRTGRAGDMVRMVRMFRVRKVTIPAVIKITRGIRDSGAMVPAVTRTVRIRVMEPVTVRMLRTGETMDREIIRTGRAGGMVRVIRKATEGRGMGPEMARITIRDLRDMEKIWQETEKRRKRNAGSRCLFWS